MSSGYIPNRKPYAGARTAVLDTSNLSRKSSPISRKSEGLGPSKNDPLFITSTWGIGWQVPALILACYALGNTVLPLKELLFWLSPAAAIAFAHLILFKFISGKPADEPNRVAPQSYITTASNVMANGFGISLRVSLSAAFAQYLWHLLRTQPMKVSTIELLFSIRSNSFQIFKTASLLATPTLCLLATFMWISK